MRQGYVDARDGMPSCMGWQLRAGMERPRCRRGAARHAARRARRRTN